MTTFTRFQRAILALAGTRPDHMPSHFIVAPEVYADIIPPEMRGLPAVLESMRVIGCPIYPSNTLSTDPGTIVLVAVEKPKTSAL